MIARLTGIFEDFGPDWAVIDGGGDGVFVIRIHGGGIVWSGGRAGQVPTERRVDNAGRPATSASMGSAISGRTGEA